jgi:phytol kinase
MYLVLTAVIVLIILLLNELLWRKRDVHGEFSRKFVHVSVGSFVAFWPFYLTWRQIEFMGLAFLICVIISKYLKVFQAIHSVQRPTLGEAFFALAVFVVALITHDKWIYMAALLQMSLADGLAAIIGIRFGARMNYIVFNHTKSVLGTLTFFIVSMVILLSYTHYSGVSLDLASLVLISVVASLLENIASFGLDNLLVPLSVALMLIYH